MSSPCYRFTLFTALWLVTLAVPAAPFPDSPEVSARAAVVMDAASGEILFAKAPHRMLAPASTTKVLTALIALERLDLNAKVTISASAADTVPSRIGLRTGEQLYVQDLLYGLLLKSGNDAAEATAEAVAGTVGNFARVMTARAHQLGARNSRFANPHGLTADGHYSTAYDLALIFRKALENPVFAEMIQTRKAALRIESNKHSGGWRLVKVKSSNRLLSSYYGARGGKTGYTRKAKLCFVGAVQRGRKTLIVAVLGSSSSAQRWQDVKTLFEYGFNWRQGWPATVRTARSVPTATADNPS